jgi:PhzF family phenazine biosynthesis protein
MTRRRFVQCDVFSRHPTQGNGLAVVVDAAGLSDAAMQRFAARTNLAETTFLLPPTDPVADYRVRIFTPRREMPFAGHPTLGSCIAWLHCGGVPRTPGLVRQECAVGLVDIDVTQQGMPAFDAPPTAIRPMDPRQLEAILSALSIPHDAVLQSAELQNGPVWQVLQLKDADAVLAADASRLRWPEFRSVGLVGAHAPGSECDHEVRMLAPSSGMSEDPITGSLNAAIARWMLAQGRLPSAMTVAQGTVIDRRGRVAIRLAANGRLWIGGYTQVLIEGTLSLPDVSG